MNCPECGLTYTAVVFNDPATGDVVRRKRQCFGCNNTFTTIEVREDVYELMKARAANFQAMVSQEARAKAVAMMERHNGR